MTRPPSKRHTDTNKQAVLPAGTLRQEVEEIARGLRNHIHNILISDDIGSANCCEKADTITGHVLTLIEKAEKSQREKCAEELDNTKLYNEWEKSCESVNKLIDKWRTQA